MCSEVFYIYHTRGVFLLGSRKYLIKHGNEIEIGDFGKVYPPEGGKSISK